jgi:hypothetical protein
VLLDAAAMIRRGHGIRVRRAANSAGPRSSSCRARFPTGVVNVGKQVTLVRVVPAAHTRTCSGFYGLVQLLRATAATVIPLRLTVLGRLAVALTVLLVLVTAADRVLVHM